VAQLGLGVGALVGRSMSTAGEPAHGLDVLFSTAHQANGAALLSAAVLAAVFVHRLSTGAATAAPAAGTSDKSLSAPAGDASI